MATDTWARETVLIIDGERSIRSVTETVLDYAGFCVLTAETRNEAIETARANANRISLVLMDPKIVDRRELIEHVRPGTRFVLATDYDASMATAAANLIHASIAHDREKWIDVYKELVRGMMQPRSQPHPRAA